MLNPRTTALATILLSCSIAAQSHAGLEGDVEQLRVVAEAHKANRDKIETWQGSAVVVKRHGEEEHRRLVNFAWDATSDSHFWRWSPDPEATAEEQEWFRFWSQNGFIQDGKAYAFLQRFPHPKFKRQGGDPALQLIIRERRGNGWKDGGHEQFHARVHLDFRGTPTIDERLMSYFREADSRLLKGSVSREGDRVVFQRDADPIVSNYVYDLSKGGNLVEFTGRTMLVDLLKSRTHLVCDWQEVDGVWVPRSSESQSYQLKKPLQSIKVKWKRNVLNEPIPEGTFTIENIGVLPGDRVIDQITGTQSIYKEDELR